MIREYIIKVSGEIMNKDEDILEGFPEIVRCKDCKHFEPDGIYTICYRHNGLSQNADWFCADGERKP